jgi:hypothetical protein
VDSPVVACTAHRPPKLGGYGPNPVRDLVTAGFREELLRLRPAGAIAGMALGGDQIFASVCCELGIPWVAAVPFLGQEERWPFASQEAYRRLLRRAFRTFVIAERPANDSEANAAMFARDAWMVDRCDLLLAAWNGSRQGGTFNTVMYASQVGRPIRRSKPPDWKFEDLRLAA